MEMVATVGSNQVGSATVQSVVAERIANEIFDLQRRQAEDFNLDRLEPYGDGEWNRLPDRRELQHQNPIVYLVQVLDDCLRERRVDDIPERGEKLPRGLGFGTHKIAAPVRKIHRGFLQPVLQVPIVDRVPDRVMAFLIGLPGGRDYLDREHHDHVGWHYHYLNSDKRRSDVGLCWDTKASLDVNRHPLFQETHGAGHTTFTARPELWGATKRESMHQACLPDLRAWKLHEFRCASSKSSPVWPTNAVLTPAKHVSARARKPSKGRR
jgi:hypothetical protein